MNYYCHRERRPFSENIFFDGSKKFIVIKDGDEYFRLYEDGEKEKYNSPFIIKESIENGLYLHAPNDILEKFGIKMETIKYYTNKSGRPYKMGDLYYIVAFQGRKSWRVYNNKTVSTACVHSLRDQNLRIGEYKLASAEILKEFGIENFIEDGYYGDSNFKSFKCGESEFVLLRTDGNWETAMVSGPDFDVPDALKGSEMANEYDKDVISGNFKKVEIE